jgi:hypothetical protein
MNTIMNKKTLFHTSKEVDLEVIAEKQHVTVSSPECR